MAPRRTKGRPPERVQRGQLKEKQFDLSRPEDWCAIIKDIAAMANSGGASILLGIKDDGTPSDWDPPNILATGSDTRQQDCEVDRGAVLRFRDRGDAARKLADS